MKHEKQIRDAMENLARKEFPEGSSVLPAIREKMQKNRFTGRWAWLRTSTGAIVLAVVSMLVLASAAAAAYFLWLDPGLRAVREAGLGSDLNVTGEQTPNPEITDTFQPVPATLVGATQTLGGVTVSLDWVSLSQMRLLIGFSASGLQEGMSFDLPQVTFVGTTTEQYRGMTLAQGKGETINATFVSYQWLDVTTLGGKAALAIDLPLLQEVNGVRQMVGTVHFDLTDIPTDSNQPSGGQQDYGVKVNGHEIGLVWAIFTPSQTLARLCYTLPTSGEDWLLQDVTGKIMDITPPPGVSGEYAGGGGGGPGGPQPEQLAESRNVTVVSTIGDQRCADVIIPLGINQNNELFILSVGKMSSPAETFNGSWDFYISLPEQGPTLGLAESAAASEPTVETTLNGKLGATLKWAYADTSRIALEIEFTHWDPNYGIGQLTIKDDLGVDVNTGYGSSSTAENPNVWTIIMAPEGVSLTASGHVNLHIDVPIFAAPNWDQPLASFHFDLSLPVYQAQVMDMDQVISAKGINMHLERVSVTPSYTELYLCYNKPTSKDWMIGYSSTLEVNGVETHMDGYSLLYDSEGYVAGKGNPPAYLPTINPGRCVQVGYPLGDLAQDTPLTMTLTIPELEQSLPEVIPDTELQAALAALRTQGIDLSIWTVSGSGGGGGGYTINSKPDSMSDEEVMRIYYQTLGYYYAGPWVFTFDVP